MQLSDFLAEWNNSESTVTVHTSGSTGKPKEMKAEKKRMLASAKMTCDFLKLKPKDTALLCMPLDYIAGKMVVVRCLERDMRLISTPPSSHPLKDINEHINFAAFVPMQVINTLKDAEETEKFKAIDNIIIGGGAIDESLERTLRTYTNNIYSSYGMTETLSHIALRKIGEPYYKPFDNVRLSQTEDGCLIIDAPLVCPEVLTTNDIVEFNSEGLFRILGRKDNTVNTGGVKVQIEEVERRIKEESNADGDFMVSSCPDPTFGEILVLLTVKSMTNERKNDLRKAIDKLPKYWQPKKTVEVGVLPLTETSKPDRATAKLLSKH